MRRCILSVVPALCLAILAGLLLAADGDTKGKKGKGKGKGKGEIARLKAQLPPGYRNLELDKEQMEKIAAIRSKNRDKFAALKKEAADLSKAEEEEMEKILTPEQKSRLQENRERFRKEQEEKRAAKKAKALLKKSKGPEEKKPEEKKSDDKK